MTEQKELLPCPFESEHHFIHETTLPRMVRCQLHTAWLSPEQWNQQSLHFRVLELERRLKIPFGKLPCAQCGGPHDFDTSVDSETWNRIIRAKGLPEYLCTTCIVREFAKAGESFSAKLWGEGLNGIPITVTVNYCDQPAEDERVKDALINARVVLSMIRHNVGLPDDLNKSAEQAEQEVEQALGLSLDTAPEVMSKSVVKRLAIQKGGLATSTPTVPDVHSLKRFALSSQCDNALHSKCGYPHRCLCSCHTAAASTEAQDATCSNRFCTDGWVDKERGSQDGTESWVEQVPCQVCRIHCDDDNESATTTPDFTEHPYYKHVSGCEHCSGPHGHCAEGLKLKNADVATDFTGQARQLFAELDAQHTDEHEIDYDRYCVDCQKLERDFLVDRIASALAEAATQGQAIMVEQVSRVVCGFCQDGNRVIFTNDAFRHHFEGEETPWFPCYADKIRELSPDPNLMDRVRNEAAVAERERITRTIENMRENGEPDKQKRRLMVSVADVLAAIGDDKEERQ